MNQHTYNANFKDDNAMSALVNNIVQTYYIMYSKIVIDFSLEGYKVHESIARVGSRLAYLSNTIPTVRDSLFHEMGHIVYVNDLKRLKACNFGLDYTTKDSLGYSVPVTWNGIKNELNVIIWQSILCKQFEIDFDMFDFATALRYMDDFINVPLKNCYEKEYEWFYDGDCTNKVNYGDKDKLRQETINDYLRVESAKPQYSLENLNSRWHKRCQWLEKNIK